MRILVTLVFISGTILNIFSQDLVAWAPTTNNLTEGEFREHTIAGVGCSIQILGHGGDGLSNFEILIYNNMGLLEITLSWPNNLFWYASSGYQIVYHALSGQGVSCIVSGRDFLRLDDDNGDFYANPDHCVKLAPMPITYQNQPTAKLQMNESHITWSVATQLNNEK